MAGKPKRMSQIKQLLRLHQQGKGNKTIARSLNISKNTVKVYLDKLRSSKFKIDTLLSMDDPILEAIFHPGNPAYKDTRFEELKDDLDYYEKELKRVGVTQKLLWEEYRIGHPYGYSHSQFCYHLSQHLLTKNPSMVLSHKPAEKLFIDFAGKKLSYIDFETGEVIYCQIFVACLPYSDYSFCMAIRSQCIADFLYALSCCLKEIGGVPQVLVPDNLKSAIIKASSYEPDVNCALEDFANHYNTTVIPTRVRKPKDKALVENQVKLIYNRVYARLRDQQFFDLNSLNLAIKDKIKDHNQTRMQQRSYCREEHFLSEEKNLLQALPEKSFELKYYREYKVAKNNHIYLNQDKHYYSVPYIYTGQKAKVVYTRSMVRIYIKGIQVALHVRDYRMGKYSTEKEHLCSTHKHYLDRSPEYYIQKARNLNEDFYQLVQQVFQQKKYPEQLYRSCDGLFSLQRKTEPDIFSKACLIALKHENYTYGFLLNIIKNKMIDQQDAQPEKPLPDHANIRGKSYYKQQSIKFYSYDKN